MKRVGIGLGIIGVLLAAACSDDAGPVTSGGSSGSGNAGSPATGGGGSGGGATGGSSSGGSTTAAGMAGSGTAGGGSGGMTAGSGGSGGASGGTAGSGGSGGSGGGAAACETKLGKAIKFNGDVADSVAGDLGADATFGDKARTVELWAKYVGQKSWAGEHTILEIGKPSQPDNGNNVWGFDMTGWSNGTGTFGPYTHGVSDNNTGASPLPTKQVANDVGWLHLSWSYDPSKQDASKRLEFTVDGDVLPTEFNQGKYNATGGKLVTNTGYVLLGASQNFGKEGWDGVMDEVRIWDVYRTPQQIKDNMRVIVKPDAPGLVAYYQFNEGDAANVSDSTKKAAHKLSACTAAGGACSNANGAAPTFVESDITGTFTCGQ